MSKGSMARSLHYECCRRDSGRQARSAGAAASIEEAETKENVNFEAMEKRQ